MLTSQVQDDPRLQCFVAREPANESLAVARAAGLFHGFRSAAPLAMRATAGRVIIIDGGGDICVLGWADDLVEEETEVGRRRCSLRPLAAPDDLVKGPSTGEQAVERVVCRDAPQLGVASSSECSISVDGALIASVDVDYVGSRSGNQISGAPRHRRDVLP